MHGREGVVVRPCFLRAVWLGGVVCVDRGMGGWVSGCAFRIHTTYLEQKEMRVCVPIRSVFFNFSRTVEEREEGHRHEEGHHCRLEVLGV